MSRARADQGGAPLPVAGAGSHGGSLNADFIEQVRAQSSVHPEADVPIAQIRAQSGKLSKSH